MATSENSGDTLLSHIDSPADLRRLSVEQLPTVCQEIRDFLIQSLSANPGHFASSMGAVELTVALHYVFNTPYDRIVWDVGHQAYGHKLLTGRRDLFDNNRKLNGLCGFPNPDESEYDTFSAGHASNSISAALGMAVASQLKHDNPRRNVVAVIGDASISGGLAFEGINNAANTPNNLLIVLNDNDMSIDRNVGSLNSYLANLTASKKYNDLRYQLFNFFKRHDMVNDRRRGAVLRFNNSLKSLLSSQQNIFEGLNIRYFGPFDGHDVATIVRVLNDIRDMEGPRILHLRTIKGKGYAPAEANPAVWHAPGKFDPETGERISDNKDLPPKYQDVFGNALLELAQENDKIVAITAAMPSGTSVSIMQHAMPDRVFDVGISEGHAVTFAGGLAKEGLRPYVAIYSSFCQRAYDQIFHDAALHRLPVTLCLDRAGLVGEDGATHHGALDMAYLRAIPGVTIASPRSAQMLRDLLYTSQLRKDGVFAIRYPRGRSIDKPDPSRPMQQMPIGKGECLNEGSDIVVASVGPIAAEVSKAIELVKAKGISVAHYDMIFVKPLDEDIIAEIAKKSVPVITVEDGTINGGLGSAIADRLSELNASISVTRIGIPDDFVTQGKPAELYKLCGMDAESIASAIIEKVKK
jgi:1-deoxy-D-xylulose-5-phosphate synthase